MRKQGEGNYNYNYDSSRSKALGVCKEQKEREEYEEYEEEGEKTSNTSSTTTPHSRCSRGVSTEELVDDEDQSNATKVVAGEGEGDARGEKVKRSEGSGSVTSASSRYSVLLQLIACGSTAAEFKGPRLSDVGTKERERVKKKALFWEENCVSENPRLFGNFQAEDKEYFSGSLVESMKPNQGEPLLKRSNSYNEERRSRLGMEEVKPKLMEEEKTVGKGGGMKDKCIPLKKSPKQSSR